jgi:acyl-[acyl-carrier-protein] desaturase
MTAPDDDALRRELEPVVARLLDRHLATDREWLPHEWLPWSRGRDFAGPDGQAWAPEQSRLDEPVRAALELNLLTEDNLPSYHHELLVRVGGLGAWGDWVRRWTAEEARHASSLRDYVLLARAVDPAALERDRMAALQTGFTAPGKGLLRALVYAALQECATRIAHRNTGRACGDPVAQRLLARIAADEHRHMVFYRDLVAAALALTPGPTLTAIADEVESFEMPGAGLPGFLRRSVLVSEAGLYDARQHRDDVVLPLLVHWEARAGTAAGAAADEARRRWERTLVRLDGVARRLDTRRRRRRDGRPPALR